MSRVFSAALLVVSALSGCKGVVWENRECPYEEIAPTERCTFERRGMMRCSTCDPVACSNCPPVWMCGRSGAGDGAEPWIGTTDYDCECLDSYGYVMDSMDGCAPDS